VLGRSIMNDNPVRNQGGAAMEHVDKTGAATVQSALLITADEVAAMLNVCNRPVKYTLA
jgi:hypothetical protein